MYNIFCKIVRKGGRRKFDFGLRIRSLREQQKISQEEFGKLVHRSKSVISSYENNIKTPPLDVLISMATIFNVSLDYLVGIEKSEMVSLNSLSEQQIQIIHLIIAEFKDRTTESEGLSAQQQEIFNALFKEF